MPRILTKGIMPVRHLIWSWVGLLLAGLLAACAVQQATITPAPSPAQTAAADTATPTQAPAAPGAETPSGELIVFAAASLTDAFTEIGQNFSAAYPGSTITYNVAGSQQLAQQLGQGAPADVFASANRSQMEVAMESGRVVSGTQRALVRNRLVVIVPGDNPAGLTRLQDLAGPGIKLVLAAREVPVGGYALEFLNKASASPGFTATYSETVLANVVSYEENVRAVLSKVLLGEADAGIVYSSDVTPAASEQVARIEIPDELNVIATYPIAPIADATNPTLAQAFVDYVVSPAGQTVLARYGFIPAD